MVRKAMTNKKILSIRYKVEKTCCLSAGKGRPKTTNVYLSRIGDGEERLVGLRMLDLRGDRLDLAGKIVEVVVELKGSP